MNETIYNIMIYGGIALAVIFAVVAVILFIRLDIPKVIGDLTGHTAKKRIKEIQEKGYESVQGSGASKKEAIKEKTNSGKISVRDIQSNEESETTKIANNRYQKAISEAEKVVTHNDYERETDVLGSDNDYERETDVLNSDNDYERATDVLSSDTGQYYEEATDVLNGGEDYESETNVLSSDATESLEEATDILSSIEDDEQTTDVLTSGFVSLVDIVVVHTEESI